MTDATPNQLAPAAFIDVGGAILVKTATCVTLFVASMTFFADACADLMMNYSLLFAPSVDATVPWVVQIGISAFAVMLTFGLVATLVRPIALGAATMFAGAVVYALILGGGLAAWCAAAAGALMLIALLMNVTKQMENQIKFTLHPVSDKEFLLSSILAVLVATSVGLGYVEDAARGGYVVPPRLTGAFESQMSASVGAFMQTELVPAALRGAAQEAAKEQVAVMARGFERLAEPFAAYVPYVLGALAYFTAQIAFFIPGFVASLVIAPLVYFLKLIRFVHVSKESRIVTRLTFAKAGETLPIEPIKDTWGKGM